MVYIVYKTINKANSKIYVGIHKQKSEEFDGYFGSGLLLWNAIKKYGQSNFTRETLFVYDNINDARQKEREIVNEDFCKRKDTYNISLGGTGGHTTAGYSEQHRQEMMEKRHRTNVLKGNYVYAGEKLQKARERMKRVRIQPDNKGRKHTNSALRNLKNAYDKRRGKYKWITNGSDTKLFSFGEQLPQGWYFGRGSDVPKCTGHTDETRRIISAKIQGDVCYNNGIVNLKLKKHQTQPEGFVKGMIQHRKAFKWITNGINNKTHSLTESMPDGWVSGRTIQRRKNV